MRKVRRANIVKVNATVISIDKLLRYVPHFNSFVMSINQ